ncbi:MAG: hypothetical protein AAGG81_02680 [Chlamydiota bacterium]
MDISIFLAKVVGLYLILGGLLAACKYNTIKEVISDYFDSPALVLIGGTMSIIIGLLMVVSHSIWEINWKIVITLTGYLTLLKGILHWFFADAAASWASKCAAGKFYLYASIVMIMLGIYLTYFGFIYPS